jgi:hypothetical protein
MCCCCMHMKPTVAVAAVVPVTVPLAVESVPLHLQQLLYTTVSCVMLLSLSTAST